MKRLCEIKKCTGCGLCINVCPSNCIELLFNNEGFLYPKIDYSRCLKCELCYYKCPQNNPFAGLKPLLYLYAKNNNIEVIQHSSSGGFFTAIANYVIENKGVVYGAVFNKDFSVTHFRASSNEEITEMRYSKYNQSDFSDVYKKIKNDLLDTRLVLVSGTPCQIDALAKYVGRPKNLILLDFICYGVMSTFVLQDWIKEKLKGIDTTCNDLNVCFRDKSIKINEPHLVIKVKNSVIYKESFCYSKKTISHAFRNHYLTRVGCYNCKYKTTLRVSDITMGDMSLDKPNNFSYSTILVNTPKGSNLINIINIKKYIILDDEISQIISRISRQQDVSINRKKFFKIYFSKGVNNSLLTIFKNKKNTIVVRSLNFISKLIRTTFLKNNH
jgi:coenzyme F420-reducing hydrogenase beta subunit